MRPALESPDIDTTAIQRQVGLASEQIAEQFVTVRELAGSADATFTFSSRTSRPVSGATGDRFFATDRNALYLWTGTAWIFVAGFAFGTNATRAGMTVDATDNGYAFFTTDTGKLWRVVSGAWSDEFDSLDLTTSLKIAGTKVIDVQGAAVASVASADATDLPTVITLANEIKAQLNTLLSRERAHGLIAP